MQDTSRNSNNREVASEARPEQTDRREVLATIGRFAYVAPALALLAEPKFAHAGYGRGGGGGGDGGGGSFGGGDAGGSSGGGSGGGVGNIGGGATGGTQRHKRRKNGGGGWFKFW